MEDSKLSLFFRRARQDEKSSYSQCGEDLIVDFLYSVTGVTKGKFIDIGAHHPTYLNNTYSLYRKGWTGVNVDPLRRNIDLFRKKRSKDVNVCAGIGETTERRLLYVMEPETLSTFDRAVSERYSQEGHPAARIEEVELYSVPDFISQFKIPSAVDLFSIDIEGGEQNVIGEIIANGIEPRVIICETALYSPYIRKAEKNNELIERIKSLGYLLYADTFMNSIFVSQKFWNE